MQGQVTVTTRVPGEMERVYSGRASVVAGKQHIVYDEVIEDGSFASVKTHLIVGEDFFEVRRSGGVETRMYFQEGNTSDSVYITSLGSIPMEIQTKSLFITRSPEIISISAAYILSSQGEEIAERVIYTSIYAQNRNDSNGRG